MRVLIFSIFILTVGCKEQLKKDIILEENDVESYDDDTSESKIDFEPQNMEMESDTTDILKIEGRYSMIKAYSIKSGKKEISDVYKAVLDIKKVSNYDFEFYRVDKYHDLTPVSKYNLVRYFKAGFYELLRCQNQEHSGPYLCNKPIIELRNDTLKITRHYNNSIDFSSWKKLNSKDSIYISLRKTLKNIKKQYKKHYTDFIKATAYDKNRLEVYNVFEDGEWHTVHHHINPDKSYYMNYICDRDYVRANKQPKQ